MRRLLISLLLVMLSFTLIACAKDGNTVVLIPLDSRPANTTEVEAFAAMTNTNILLPEQALLDTFTTPAQSETLFNWLDAQDGDHYIIYTNELLNGGLIASRNLDSYHDLSKKIERLKTWLKSHKDKDITLVTVLPRHLPSQFDPALSPYISALDEWSRAAHRAKLSAQPIPPAPLGLPQEAIDRYRALYDSSGALVDALVPLAEEGLIDRYYVSLDDYTAESLATDLWQERQRDLSAKNLQQTEFIKGADELTMMLIAKKSQPTSKMAIQIHYTSEATKKNIPDYEGQPLSQTVREKTAFFGIEENPESKNILLIHNDPTNSEAVAKFLADHPNHRIALADVAYTNKGDAFLWPLLKKWPDNLVAYSGWNTAANSIGTALAWLMVEKEADDVEKAAFRTLRLAQDQIYLALLAPEFKEKWRNEEKIDSYGCFTSQEARQICEKELNSAFDALRKDGELPPGKLRFPWPRTFEVAFHSATEKA